MVVVFVIIIVILGKLRYHNIQLSRRWRASSICGQGYSKNLKTWRHRRSCLCICFVCVCERQRERARVSVQDRARMRFGSLFSFFLSVICLWWQKLWLDKTVRIYIYSFKFNSMSAVSLLFYRNLKEKLASLQVLFRFPLFPLKRKMYLREILAAASIYLSICLCVCMHVCVSVCMHAFTYVCAYV